ncbi:hypothetical protein [Bradyrhizobium sp.]|uniref:hypothetical protein n=1 Tax=Bradyrhizobium sp. TaxID=376 RepID=UPI003C6F46B7
MTRINSLMDPLEIKHRGGAPRHRDRSRRNQPSCKVKAFTGDVVRASLPPKGEARDWWLTRNEAAALI